jgi:hypothetical protein
MANKGGRPKGSLNKDKQAFRDQLAELDCNEVEGLVQFALDSVPCKRCHPTSHKVNHQTFLIWAECTDPVLLDTAKSIRSKLPCPWCAGTGTRIIEPGHMLLALKELIARSHAKLASQKIEKTVRRVRLARMNAVSAERRRELEKIAEQEESSGNQIH